MAEIVRDESCDGWRVEEIVEDGAIEQAEFVGPGAEARAKAYKAVVEAARDLAPKASESVVTGRGWDAGVDVVLAKRIVRLLNELLAIDPEAMRRLVLSRVPCNEKLADHPTVQVGEGVSDDLTGWVPVVGLLGILNGLCGKYAEGPQAGSGPVAVIYPSELDSGDISASPILRFEVVENVPR